MDKVRIIQEVRDREQLFRSQGITHVWLFGSVARGDAGPDSDVDLFFDHAIPDLTAFGYVGLKQMAQDTLPFKVDFIERESLHPALRTGIEGGAEQIF